MRWMIGATALVVASQAGAQTTGLALRPGEVALHIVARGETTNRADRITVPVTIAGRGATLAEARASAAAEAGEVQTALIKAGVDHASINVQPFSGRTATAFNPMNFNATASGGAAAHTPSRTDTVTMQVAVSDRASLDRAMQALAAQEQAQAGTPIPSLRDEAPARRAAVAAAIARARHDADDYAAALGMQVVRVVAVSNAAGLADGVETVVQSFHDLEGKDKTPDSVITRATSVVDYVAAPKG